MKVLKPIDLATIVVAVATAYYFREAVLLNTMTWQLIVLGCMGFVLGMIYHFQGNTLGTSERSQAVFLLTYIAMVIPAVISSDGWTILFAWAFYGPMAVPLVVPMYVGWGMPMLFGRKAPAS